MFLKENTLKHLIRLWHAILSCELFLIREESLSRPFLITSLNGKPSRGYKVKILARVVYL